MHVLKVSSCIKEHMSLQGMCLVCVCLHVCACHSSPLCDIGGVSSGMLQGPALRLVSSTYSVTSGKSFNPSEPNFSVL